MKNKFRKHFEKNNSYNFSKILESIINNNGEINSYEAALLIKPYHKDLLEHYWEAREYLSDLLDVKGIKQSKVIDKESEFELYQLDIEHLRGLPASMYSNEIKEVFKDYINRLKAQ